MWRSMRNWVRSSGLAPKMAARSWCVKRQSGFGNVNSIAHGDGSLSYATDLLSRPWLHRCPERSWVSGMFSSAEVLPTLGHCCPGIRRASALAILSRCPTPDRRRPARHALFVSSTISYSAEHGSLHGNHGEGGASVAGVRAAFNYMNAHNHLEIDTVASKPVSGNLTGRLVSLYGEGSGSSGGEPRVRVWPPRL